MSWSAPAAGERAPRRIALPTYPFYRDRHWLPPRAESPAAARLSVTATPAPSSARARTVAVIGAGPAGLAAAKCLRDDGHLPFVFERSDRIGGIWAFRDNHQGGPYQSTRLQTSKFTSLFSDFPPPDDMPVFPGVTHVQQYLQAYVDHFNIRAAIQLETALERMVQDGDRWQLSLRRVDGRIEQQLFDAVCICTGAFWTPKIIDFPGIERFTGERLHSANYGEPSIFKGKKVLVIGNGVSGMDIAVEAVAQAESVTLSLRSKKMVIPRMFGFTTNDSSITSVKRLLINQQSVGEILKEWQGSIPDYIHHLLNSQLLPEFPTKENILLVNDDYVREVSLGHIQIVAEPQLFEAHHCVFADGSRIKVDLIVDCTGYEEPSYPFLPMPIRLDELYKSQFHPDYRNLSFMGRKRASLSVIPTVELEARWFSKILTGECQLPSAAEMRASSASDLRRQARVRNLFPSIDSSQQNIWIADQIGAFPNPVRDWPLYWKLVNMPATPYVYRLVGPHPWPQAEAYLERLRKRLYVNNNDPRIEELKFKMLARLGRENLEHMLSLGHITQAELTRALAEIPAVPQIAKEQEVSTCQPV